MVVGARERETVLRDVLLGPELGPPVFESQLGVRHVVETLLVEEEGRVEMTQLEEPVANVCR